MNRRCCKQRLPSNLLSHCRPPRAEARTGSSTAASSASRRPIESFHDDGKHLPSLSFAAPGAEYFSLQMKTLRRSADFAEFVQRFKREG